MPMENRELNTTKINKSFFLSVIIIFALLLLFSMREFFTAFLGSIMFYVLFKPWMEFLVKRKKWKKSRAAILVVVVSFLIIMLPIISFSSLIFNKISPLISHPEITKAYIEEIQKKFNVVILSEKNIAQVQSYAASMVSDILNMGLSAFSSITMMYFFMYFLRTDYFQSTFYRLTLNLRTVGKSDYNQVRQPYSEVNNNNYYSLHC